MPEWGGQPMSEQVKKITSQHFSAIVDAVFDKPSIGKIESKFTAGDFRYSLTTYPDGVITIINKTKCHAESIITQGEESLCTFPLK
jgi:hypothetical protein